MFVFRKIWCALVSYYLRFEIRPSALLPTIYQYTIIYTYNFPEHLNDIISKISRKVNALSGISLYVNMDKKQILVNSIFSTQSSYCQLQFFYSRTTNNKKDRLHEICPKVLYNDETPFFENLLEKIWPPQCTKNVFRSLQHEYLKHSKYIPAYLRINPLMHNVPKWSDAH